MGIFMDILRFFRKNGGGGGGLFFPNTLSSGRLTAGWNWMYWRVNLHLVVFMG